MQKQAQIDDKQRVIFSGIQPTGVLHLGNYFGAVSQWVKLQDEALYKQMLISIVDLHAITVFKSDVKLGESIKQMLACLLACGLDPAKTVVFQQSHVPEHTALMWILSTLATLPQLQSMPNFKEKSARFKEGEAPLALFSYPVLQAADILLYNASHVPVGEDQTTHLALARKLASNFNSRYNVKYFRPPETISSDFVRVKSLRNPLKKMSKSDDDKKSCLNLDDSADEIVAKCKKAVTDFTSRVTYDPDNRPGVSNLLNIHKSLTQQPIEVILAEIQDLSTAQYKLLLAQKINEKFQPLRVRYLDFINRPAVLKHILLDGQQAAHEVAVKRMIEIKNIIGMTIS